MSTYYRKRQGLRSIIAHEGPPPHYAQLRDKQHCSSVQILRPSLSALFFVNPLIRLNLSSQLLLLHGGVVRITRNFLEEFVSQAMRPEKVVEWREQLPPPFDKPLPPLRRSASTAQLHGGLDNATNGPGSINDSKLNDAVSLTTRTKTVRKRRNSAPETVDQVDRRVSWLRFNRDEHARLRHEKSEAAILKLKRLDRERRLLRPTFSDEASSFDSFDTLNKLRQRRASSGTPLQAPTTGELLSLAYQCFPPLEHSRVVITDFSANALCTSEYTLEEVLASKCILQPRNSAKRVRWIYIEYYKLGTFWGSDARFAQWGTDPTLFEKSPVQLVLNRLAELDRELGRPPLKEIEDYKAIGKYFRQTPGCPEYLGLRVSPAAWLKSEPYQLLLQYLELHPELSKELRASSYTDLDYGMAYASAVRSIREGVYGTKPGLRELHGIAADNDVYLYGNWDDTVERLEFYGEDTLVSCGSPRFYRVVAERLARREDVLRQNPDCALLYYTLARVSIENDEMMQDAPERALNKVFESLVSNRNTGRKHIELLFSLQQAVLDGLGYLEENKRELPIWGIPPFENHQVLFHPNYDPPPNIRKLIQDEMDLIDKDFDSITGHWRSLKAKVERYLDVLLQFRVLEQQELTVQQSQVATQQQVLAIDEARSARIQSRAIFIFTTITIIFMPLSFFTSYFGMNFIDIANTKDTSRYFWMTAGPVTVFILVIIYISIKSFKTIGDPVLDEESGTVAGNGRDYKRPWYIRWRRRESGKVKAS
ncbi:hypothetical protein NLU13_5942 [Sarocladium strictum]|uniref:Uncharacterized protein n=1 Tax=Sarocladium strictum TaxID=5046 RepID=A0AA39L6T4_SARSR|nr:hypothetical protein NLU13_5942 [Sarocladium strictum]